MFWRFGFSSTSTLDTLLDRPNVSLEEILDEDDLLQECKTQNSKLIDYLQQPRVLKRLFQHVAGTAQVGGSGGREWEEKVRFKYPYIASEVLSSDIWSIVDNALSNSDDLLVPFWDAILTRESTINPPTVTQHQHPLFQDTPTTPGGFQQYQSNATAKARSIPGEEPSGSENSSVGVLGLEVKSNDEGTTVTSARDNGPGKSVLAGYWAKVNGVFLDKKPREMLTFIQKLPSIVELFVAHMETPAVVDLLYRIIQCEEAVPNIGVIDWLSAQDLMPRLIELLSPSHSSDLHNTVSELLKAIIALSAPSPASLTQGSGTEAFGFGGPDSVQTPGNASVGGVNNRLVRELASEAIVRKMVGFMLDASLPTRLTRRLSEAAEEQSASENSSTPGGRSRPSELAASRTTLFSLTETPADKGGSSEDSAVDDEEDSELEFEARTSRRPLNPRDTPASEQSSVRSPAVFDHHRDSTATIRPSSTALTPVRAPEVDVSPESCTSTLVTCISVLIELIRKNNSDYFEQHLFHTLRTHLLQRQQEIAEKKANRTVSPEAKDEENQQSQQEGEEDEDDEMEGMEEAMAELSDKLGIVHLGPMLRVLCERLSDFQQLISRQRSNHEKVLTSLGETPALTFERYRITELYAELLHCSNMALLNRAAGEGPQYSDEGVLQGGIEGLQVLARTLQGTDAASDSGQDHSTTEKTANVAPVSTEGTSESAQASSGATGHSNHARQSSTVGGGNGSEDTDDEALLSEVSLSETNESESRTPATSTDANAAGNKDGLQEEANDGDQKAREDDEIKSVLSHLSLADLTSPSAAPSGPPSPIDEKRDYVVGDFLKKSFLECEVIPTILLLFFEYPWNNFLHNVVYDILQQFFNGRMDVGLNRKLTLAVFDQGHLTEKIVQGDQRNKESLQSPRKIRMGYMGHMQLIAEETVKLLERYPQEIAHFVEPHISDEWKQFVSETLRENREREAAPLAGGRPQMMHSLAFPQHAGGGLSGAEGDYGGGQNVGSDAFANYLSSQMRASNSSDDDDSDEDSGWLSQDPKHRSTDGGNDAFDDAFATSSAFDSKGAGRGAGASLDVDDDDEWGPFADSASGDGGEGGASDAGALSSAHAYLTPADWAADFQRETSAADKRQNTAISDEHDSGSSSASNNDAGTLDEESGRLRSDSNSSENNGTPFVDLLDTTSVRSTDVVAAAHARRPSLDQTEPVSPGPLQAFRPRASSNSGSSDPTAADAADSKEPLGPGVAADAQADHTTGLIERVIDGKTVKVPLDDVALVSQSQSNEHAIED